MTGDTFSDISLAIGFGCAILIAWDVFHHPQKMKVMNVVWPITGLYGGPLAVWAWFAIGRPQRNDKPFWQKVLVASTHCSAGCTVGDVAAIWGVFWTGLLLFRSPTATDYVSEFVMAYLFGIAFQYFSIVPMRHLPPGKGILAALKADTISLTAYEVGMFVAMALLTQAAGGRTPPTDPMHWLIMQVAMLVGLATAYPANWWLLRKGWKEAM